MTGLSAATPVDVLAALEGKWRLDRRISGGICAEGSSLFIARGPNSLLYEETVRLHLPGGQSLDGTRRYIFEGRENGFSVFFDEAVPRLFHSIELSAQDRSLTGQAIHHCGADIYESTYVFEQSGIFRIDHAVKGPRKDYLIETCYRR